MHAPATYDILHRLMHEKQNNALLRPSIIFDLDGVLIDSAADHLASWQRLAAELGKRVTDRRFRETFGRQNRDAIPMLFGDGWATAELDRLSERKERHYRDIATGRIKPVPGAQALVKACADADFNLAVGSSGHPENIEMALRELKILPLFSAVVSGHDVTKGKPDPEVFNIAAWRLDADPMSCVVIEDAPAGIEAAQAAGMKAIALTGNHPQENLKHADRVVDRLDELSPDDLRALIE